MQTRKLRLVIKAKTEAANRGKVVGCSSGKRVEVANESNSKEVAYEIRVEEGAG